MISVLLSIVLSISMMTLCSGTAWTKISNGLCRRGAPFANLVLAQAACRKLGSSCQGVDDEHCDGRTSYLCMDNSLLTPRSTSCVYEPTANTLAPSAFSPESNTELKRAVDALAMCSTTAAPTTTPVSVFSPQSRQELQSAVEECMRIPPFGDCIHGSHGPIGEWDVSRVTDMSGLFANHKYSEFFEGDISKWDVSRVTTMSGMFSGANTFNVDISKWDVSRVTDMSGMFYDATLFNADISKWDVSRVTTMSEMFGGAKAFNGQISKWDVSRVTDMGGMFSGAEAFNGDISKWDVSSVTTMLQMFHRAQAFNRDISKWDVSHVVNMVAMFKHAKAFNRHLTTWDVSSVTSMREMFYGAIAFKGDISKWDVSSVTNMGGMFFAVKGFNRDLSKWDVSKVTNMSSMFSGANTFNRDIAKWDVSSVTDMQEMFNGAKRFNGDLYYWDVSKVTNMIGMFNDATAFNGDIAKWDVSQVTDMSDMFTNAKKFNVDLSRWNVFGITNILRMKGAVFEEDDLTWAVEANKGKMGGGLEWYALGYVKEKDKSQSQISYVPGPKGGLRFAGAILQDDGFASCQTNIDDKTLGFSEYGNVVAEALRLEVSADGQNYRVGLREKDRPWGAPVWEAEFETLPGGIRTELTIPLNKEVWKKTIKGLEVEGGELPQWNKLRGVGFTCATLDMKGKHVPRTLPGPFEIIVHSIEIVNSD